MKAIYDQKEAADLFQDLTEYLILSSKCYDSIQAINLAYRLALLKMDICPDK